MQKLKYSISTKQIIYKSVGCDVVISQEYSGRKAVYEVIETDAEFKSMIHATKVSNN